MQEKTTLESIIQQRKSTFVNGLLEGGKIEDEVILKILDNAVWAPTHGLAQTWFFKVFADGGVDSFFRVQQEIYKLTTEPDRFNQVKYEKYTTKSSKVSHVVAVLAERDPKKRFPKQEDMVAAACAVQNIYLSLPGYGIGGYLSTGNLCYTQQMRDFLELGEEDECLGFFILGIPDEDFKRPSRKRIPASEKTQWIRS